MNRITSQIKNFFYWGWALRQSWDWDFGYAEKVFLLKLKRLRESMNTCEFHMNLDDLYEAMKDPSISEFDREHHAANIKAYRALNVVISLLERQQDCNFYGEFVGIYDFLNNHTSDKVDSISKLFNHGKIKTTIPHEEYRKKLLTLHQSCSIMEERDRSWAYSLIAKYSQSWWI